MKLNPFVVSGLLLISMASFAEQSGIPVVPASVMEQKKPQKSKQQPSNRSSEPVNIATGSTLTMKPGQNQIIKISQGNLNRIVTPFAEPKVTTTSQATTKISENVVYVATEGTSPVTMFITESGSESLAMSLTMLPKSVPPIEVFLKLDGGTKVDRMANKKAKRWEEGQPYVSSIRSAFKKIALGEVPSGYQIREPKPGVDKIPYCTHEGLDINFSRGQVLHGHNLSILVGTMRNVSNQPIEFRESECGGWDTAAVAAWPHNVLEPGQYTEVYLAQKIDRYKPSPDRVRPSLLGHGGAQ